ncbi:hypothetical protein V8E36_009796 [Tilletia maclaganii]
MVSFGYEFFKKAHYVLALVYIGACWGHWAQLKCFLIPSLALWFIDRAVRLTRTAILHYQPSCTLADPSSTFLTKFGFRAAYARLTLFPDIKNGDVVRLDFRHPARPWKIGQHFFLCFMEGSIWQSHPLTPLSLPQQDPAGSLHSYIFRAKQGETKRIALLASKKLQGVSAISAQGPATLPASNYDAPPSTKVILNGPYGASDPSIRLRIFVTRESGIVSEVREDDGTPPIKEERDGDLIEDIPAKIIGADSSTSTPDDHARPNVGKLIEHFVLETIISDGETAVFASGPSGMLSEARRAVASLNSGRGVLRGSATAGGGLRASVRFIDDERLEL